MCTDAGALEKNEQWVAENQISDKMRQLLTLEKKYAWAGK